MSYQCTADKRNTAHSRIEGSARTAIVYPYFAHYRSPIMRELSESDKHTYEFFSDDRVPECFGIELWGADNVSHTRTKCRFLLKRFLLQSGLLCLSFSRRTDCIIYLGDFQYITTWISAVIARLSGKRVLFWTHGWRCQEKGPKGWLRNTFYRLANGLLLYGNNARSIGIHNGFHPDDLYVVYNSLDFRRLTDLYLRTNSDQKRNIRASLFGDPSSPVLICSCRLLKSRRLDLLLEAVQLLQADGKKVNLVLIGDGPAKPDLEHYAEVHRIPVKFVGPCYDEDKLSNLFATADVTVVPDRVGLTAIHSLSYGTPVVTHSDRVNHGPEWEAIHPGFNGAFFERGNVADMARVIWQVASDLAQGMYSPQDCRSIVEKVYNPKRQAYVIDCAVSGIPASSIVRDEATHCVAV